MARPKKEKQPAKPMPKGQSANPAGNDKMRRIQAVLNARYADEWYAVDVLDRARNTKDDEGELLTDRHIISEALRALGEKYPDNFALPPMTHQEKVVPPQLIQHIVDSVLIRLDNAFKSLRAEGEAERSRGTQWDEQREAIRDELTITVSGVVSTGNLTGDSYKYEDTDDDDDWSK